MKLRTAWFAFGVFGLAAVVARAEDGDEALLGGGFVEIVKQGGPVMVVILLGSIVGLAFAFDRLFALRRSALMPKKLVAALRDAIKSRDLGAAEVAAEGARGPLARIVTAGVGQSSAGAADMERAMEGVGSREVARLKRPIRPLSILATVEPLLGLLGTILGMITTFNALHTTSAAERVAKLAPGIGQALYTTAAGLTVAIPFVVLFHYLTGRVNRAAEEWSLLGSELIAAANDGPGAADAGAGSSSSSPVETVVEPEAATP